MKEKKNKNLLLGVGIFAFVVFIKLFLLYVDGSSLKDSLTLVFGYIGLQNKNRFIMNFSTWIVPQLAIILLFGEYFKNELIVNSSIILIRSSSRTKILMQYIIKLIKKALMCVLCEIVFVCGLSVIKGNKINIDLTFLCEVISICMYITMLIVLINAIGLYTKTTYAVVISIFLECIQVYFIENNIKVARLLPLSGILYEVAGKELSSVVPLMINSIIWLVVVIVITVVAFRRKKDII